MHLARRSPVRVAAAALVLALPGARDATAQVGTTPAPALTYSDIELAARLFRYGAEVDSDVDAAAPGAPGIVTTLHQGRDLLRFPTSRSALPGGFASATMASAGIGGAGVSFWSPHTPDLTSLLEWTQSITNDGTADAALWIDYTIPLIEASIMAGPSYGPFPSFAHPTVRALALLQATHYRADGTLSNSTVFEYMLKLERVFSGGGIGAYTVTRSDDLATERGLGGVIQDGDVTGIQYAPFSSSRRLPVLEPGGRLFLQYFMEVDVLADRSDTPELGYQGLVGDPFDINAAGAGLRVRLANPTAVPEPASLLLLATGLAVLPAAARARRRLSAGGSPP